MKNQRENRLLRELKVVQKSFNLQQREIKWGRRRVPQVIAEADRKKLSVV